MPTIVNEDRPHQHGQEIIAVPIPIIRESDKRTFDTMISEDPAVAIVSQTNTSDESSYSPDESIGIRESYGRSMTLKMMMKKKKKKKISRITITTGMTTIIIKMTTTTTTTTTMMMMTMTAQMRKQMRKLRKRRPQRRMMLLIMRTRIHWTAIFVLVVLPTRNVIVLPTRNVWHLVAGTRVKKAQI
jgi:hypothetical protein